MRRGLLLTAAIVTALASLRPTPGGAEETIDLEITAPADGALVSGLVPLEARTTGPVTSVAFAWSADAGATWREIGSIEGAGPTWSLTWDTAGHHGPARLRATATNGLLLEDVEIAVMVDAEPPEVAVTVFPAVFSPNGDRRRERTTIRASVSEASEVEVRVHQSGGAMVRRWVRRTSGPGTVRIGWNGRAGGSPVPDGRYRVRARATDRSGLTARGATSVVVDTRPPKVRWRRIAPEPLVLHRRMAFTFRARDRARRLRVDLRVLDAAGRRVARARRRVAPGLRTVRWRPRRPGRRPLYPGVYQAVLRVRDDAGNVSRPRPHSFRVHRPAPAGVFTRLPGAGRRVALTFDDCHFRGAWSRILDVLRRKRVRATFFCPGRLVRWNPDLARRTVRDGHVPAAHAWDHALLRGLGAEATARRVRADARAWWEVTGTTSAPYFRPPYGAFDGGVLAGAGRAFHPRVMLWDVDTSDWRRPGSAAIAARAVGGSRPGSVVLMHTLDQTASALPAIIDGLRQRGLEPVGLPELFRAAGLP